MLLCSVQLSHWTAGVDRSRRDGSCFVGADPGLGPCTRAVRACGAPCMRPCTAPLWQLRFWLPPAYWFNVNAGEV
jgi:hypothetical protein